MFRFAIVLFVLPSMASAQRPWKAKPATPTELAKGRGYRIHAVPLGQGLQGIGEKSAWLLLHTSLPDGKLTILAKSGESATFSPPMAIDRIFYKKIDILGVVAFEGKLIVLTRRAKGAVMRIPKAKKTPDYGEPEHRLTIYDARKGEKRGTIALKEVKIPGDLRPTLKSGPLTLKGNVLSLFGRNLRIDTD